MVEIHRNKQIFNSCLLEHSGLVARTPCSNETWLNYKLLLQHSCICFLKVEGLHFEFRSESVSQQEKLSNTWHIFLYTVDFDSLSFKHLFFNQRPRLIQLLLQYLSVSFFSFFFNWMRFFYEAFEYSCIVTNRKLKPRSVTRDLFAILLRFCSRRVPSICDCKLNAQDYFGVFFIYSIDNGHCEIKATWPNGRNISSGNVR